jgi:eukaryotic-like serine/threonine-protein kinase
MSQIPGQPRTYNQVVENSIPSAPGEHWRRIEAIHAELEPLSAEERERRLLALQPPALASEVRALFEAVDAEAAAQIRFSAEADSRSPLAPQLVGYEILDRLGSGGAGVVYRARRLIDHGAPQPVAVKVFHVHRAGLVDQRRFVRELNIVSTLDHPAIVKFFDGGFTPDGSPFFVMELVEGMPLTAYCELHRLSFKDRLQVLLAIFDAIAWAHSRLVVHLDLKPSNILVTAHGAPKVLDFGAARLLEFAEEITVTQQITPQYASPERLRGEPPSVASDVYSLGLLLFEVLSGAWPFPFRDSILGLAERAANAVPLLSLRRAAVAECPYASSLDADLDAICAKALAFDPAERYASVNDLADDVRRRLDGKPVRAHPPSRWYRLRKFIRRNYLRLAFAAVFVSGLGAAVVYSTVQARKARDYGSQAERAVATLQELLEQSHNGRAAGGRDMTVKEMLEIGATRIVPSLASTPAIGVDFAIVLTRAFIAQSDFPQARATVNQALQLAERSGDTARRASALASSSNVSYAENRPDAAWDEAHRALAIWKSNRQAFSPERSFALLEQTGMSMLYSRPADATAGEAFTACLALAGPDRRARPGCLEGLANVAINSRNAYEEALPLLLEVVAIRRSGPPDPVSLATSLQAFGLANRYLARYAQDEAAQREALALVETAEGQDSLFTANFRAVWASSLASVGRSAEGQSAAESALRVYRRKYPQPGANLLWTPLSAAMINACLNGRFADCERYAREAQQTLGPKPSPNDGRLFASQGHLGWAFAHLGRSAEAKILLQESIAFYRRRGRRPFTLAALEATLQSLP